RMALGERGAQWIAVGIAISTLGFLSQSVLTAPRVYYAMAQDGLFFRAVGRLSQRTDAPVAAIVLQGIAATVIACSGRYGEILNCGVSVAFISWGMGGGSLCFSGRRGVWGEGFSRAPGLPSSAAIFVRACAGFGGGATRASPANSAIALGILVA